MKKILYKLSALVLLTSCSLIETPYGFYSGDNFYKTPADAQAAVNYIYDAIGYIEYSRAIVFLGDMNTDCLSPKGDAAARTKNLDVWQMENMKTNETLGNFFKYSYITINRANSVIENVGGMTGIDEDMKNRFLGEAYFMRAYSYFNLARNFGRVPVHLKTVTTLQESAVPAAESLDAMWDIIISDFSQAADLLPLYKKPELGHADKAAAKGFLAKAYLYLASAKASGTPQYKDMSFSVDDYYSKAVDAADFVINGQSTYGFEANLIDIYDVEKPDGKEHLFLMSMDRTGDSEGQYSKISKMYIPYIAGGEIYINVAGSGVMIPTHDGWSEYQTTAGFYNSFEAGDLRKDHLICKEVYDADGNISKSYPDGGLTYPFSLKFIDPKHVGDKTSTRPFLLRYSDVALIYAEAAGPTTKSYELVNAIRTRAGLAELTPGLGVEDFRKAVINERVWELSFEGNMAYDLRRTNLLHTDVTAVFEQHLSAEDVVFYPIPNLETELNPNLK